MRVFNPLKYLARLIHSYLGQMLYRMSTKRTLHGIPVAANLLSSQEEKEEEVFEKIDSALELIARFAPKKFRSLRKVVSSIYVTGGFWGIGRYQWKQKLVELNRGYVTDSKTTRQDVACTLIHEAQHGRLHRLGFGYEDAVRTRIERICMTAERNFARKLPGNEALAAQLEERIDFDWEPFLSDEALWRADQEASIEEIKDLSIPDWFIRLAEWQFKRAARRHFPQSDAS